MGNFTHADVLKIFENGTISCDMLIMSEDIEQYSEHLTTFDSGADPFELRHDNINILNPKPNATYTDNII